MAGEKSAIAEAVEVMTAEEVADEADLFGLSLPETPSLQLLRERKGPGRPAGARNKRTERTVGWLLAQFRDPRAVLLEIAQTPVDELAAALGCKPIEALQEIRHAAVGVLPYVAAKMPVQVDLTGKPAVHMHFNMGGAPGAEGTGTIAERLLGIIVQDQTLSEGDDA